MALRATSPVSSNAGILTETTQSLFGRCRQTVNLRWSVVGHQCGTPENRRKPQERPYEIA